MRTHRFQGAFRDYLRSMSIRNGAKFSSDLTRDITHLVARDTQSQKYKYATQWNIIIVTRQWFTDSLERGMILDEALYNPLLPPEQQGAGAWNRAVPLARETASDRNPPSNPRPRKLRRTASAKLVGQNEGIWGDIVGAGFDSSDLRRSRGSQHRSDSTRTLPRTASLVQEARSFASESGPAEPRDSRQSKLGRQSSGPVAENEGFLHGCYFFIHGFSSKQVGPSPGPLNLFVDSRMSGKCTTPSPLLQWGPVGRIPGRILAARDPQTRPWPLHHRAVRDAAKQGAFDG